MIHELRALRIRLERLEAQLQRSTQDIRDDGTIRVRVGRQPDGAYTIRVHDAGGDPVADLLDLEARVAALEGP